MKTIAEWHDRMNRDTAVREILRVRQFGLRTDIAGLPGEVWAWQGPEPPVPPQQVVRVGFTGERLHVGHLGLARTAARLAGRDGRVLVFAAGSGRSMVDGFTAAVDRYSRWPTEVKVVEPSAELDGFRRRALAALKLGRVRRLYGWDERTSLARLSDLADMLAFFLYGTDDRQAGVALADAMQAAHSALLPQAARALERPMPAVLYRRLFPHLRTSGQRGSARDETSTVFADDGERAVREKFVGALTGGRHPIRMQRELGGRPARCSAFALIELLCPPDRAQAALERCLAGATTCQACKADNTGAVTDGLRKATSPLRTRTSPAATSAVASAATRLHRPPPAPARLEQKIATAWGAEADQVVAANGSTEVMEWIFRLHARPGGRVIATEPDFELYRHLAERHGLEFVPVPWRSGSYDHDLDLLANAIDERTAVCAIGIPHAVSGTVIPWDQALSRLTPPRQGALVVDLAYVDYMADRPELDARTLERLPGVVLCGSFSKSSCLLGARVGYGLAARETTARLRSCRLPYGLNALAISAAEAALDDREAIGRTVEASRQARAALTGALADFGIRHVPTEANFLLFEPGDLAEPVMNELRRNRAPFRDGRRWGLGGWIQVHLIDLYSAASTINAIQAVASRENVVSPEMSTKGPDTTWRKAHR